MKKSAILIFLATLLISCNRFSGGDTSFTPGQVTDQVQSATDPDVKYALYVPKDFDDDALYPVIIAFDPHATGSLPLAMYKDLADRYGYILVGSNTFRNGLDGNQITGIITGLLKEVKRSLPVDSSRIFAMGFSGGARVAVMAGFLGGGIGSVTGAGAGFPAVSSGVPAFDYLGMAGNEDFNMDELIMTDKHLDQTGNNHGLVLFEGKHEWPPHQVMEFSFIWNDFSAMRRNLIPVKKQVVDRLIALNDSITGLKSDEKDFIGLWYDVKNAIGFLNGISDVSKYKQYLTDLENSPEYKKDMERHVKMQAQGWAMHDSIQKNFFTRDTVWWSKQLATWEDTINSGKDQQEVLYTKRLKGYLSLLCYMNYTRATEMRETEAAARAMWIYEKVDPENAAKTKNGK